MKNELDLISEMLQTAFYNKLEVEVVTAFYYAVKNNPDMDLKDLVFIALGKWDCNSIEDEYGNFRFIEKDGEDEN